MAPGSADNVSPTDEAGVVISQAPEGSWAWIGLQLVAAADLSEIREYADLPDELRRRKVLDEQIAFLGALMGASPNEPTELRWIWDPHEDAFSCYLLTRAAGSTAQEAEASARQALNRIRSAPRTVFTEALSSDQLSRVLLPFRPHPNGCVDIRKRAIVARPQRPDARVQYYLAVQPFAGTTRSWDPLLRTIASSPNRICLTIGLKPTAVSASFTEALGSVSTNYLRLASPTQAPRSGLYGGRSSLTPDAFAVEAQRMYEDARRRYLRNAFELRISVFSNGPLDDGIPSAVGATVSRDDRENSSSYLDSTAVGAAYRLVRPSPTEYETYVRNVHSLSYESWGPDPAWNGPAGAPEILYPLTYLVDPEEASTSFRLPTALEGTIPKFPVRSRPPAVFVDYQPAGPAIPLGRQDRSGHSGTGVFSVEVADLNQHALFVGTTGSGKTNSTLSFLRHLWRDHRVPFLVLEPVNSERDDYRWLATEPGFEDLLVLTVGDDQVAPLRMNPFETPTGVRVSTHMANLLAAFDAAFGLWDPLPIVYKRALRRTYASRGIPSDGRGSSDTAWPVLSDFVEAIRAEVDRLEYAGEVRANIVAASTMRAESLLEGPCGTTLAAHTSYPVETLLERPIVIELAAVGDDPKEQSLIMALLLNSMTEWYKANRDSSRLQHVTVIEEAHRLLGKPTATSAATKEGNAQALAAERFANTLAENRKYGEGLVIVDQDPAKLIPDAYKNTNLKVMHRLPSEADRALIGDTMRFSDDQRAYASTLNKMVAFAFHSQVDRPALVQVADVRAESARAAGLETAPYASTSDLRSRFQATLNEEQGWRSALHGDSGETLAYSVTPFVAGFKRAINNYPNLSDSRLRPAWWTQLFEDLRDQGLTGSSPRTMLEALLEKAYPGGKHEPWIEQFQRYFDEGPPEP